VRISGRALLRGPILGKSSRWTSSGSSMPLRVTMICLGCSSGGSERMRAATSSAVFHLASWPRRFWPAHTLVWMIFKKSWPVRGLKMKMAPLMGFVVKLPCAAGERRQPGEVCESMKVSEDDVRSRRSDPPSAHVAQQDAKHTTRGQGSRLRRSCGW